MATADDSVSPSPRDRRLPMGSWRKSPLKVSGDLLLLVQVYELVVMLVTSKVKDFSEKHIFIARKVPLINDSDCFQKILVCI